mmetsp:Transcript_8232/g.15340  ORF Transcript_8232/g.15340 Transcript_8232/m.15340 type:complete len:219 (+) Transcript_8232:741-1397(+)
MLTLAMQNGRHRSLTSLGLPSSSRIVPTPGTIRQITGSSTTWLALAVSAASTIHQCPTGARKIHREAVPSPSEHLQVLLLRQEFCLTPRTRMPVRRNSSCGVLTVGQIGCSRLRIMMQRRTTSHLAGAAIRAHGARIQVATGLWRMYGKSLTTPASSSLTGNLVSSIFSTTGLARHQLMWRLWLRSFRCCSMPRGRSGTQSRTSPSGAFTSLLQPTPT